ncbi:MAG: hypothetical protein KF889_16540 [Alphaproteobacteria bacterium]|nr:hypothetical protein [Alphaproteobacteria bacterium]MCW5740022.1 hypothetical protein [Alphaproteobacteria bacterium]
MRSEREILEFIRQALREKDEARRLEQIRRQEENEQKKVFYQAARAVLTHVVLPGMTRVHNISAQAGLRAAIGDTGDFYLPDQPDPTLVAKFAMPLPKTAPELPLCVSFKAVFPHGFAVYFTDVDKSQADAKGTVEEVPLEDVTPEMVEICLLRVLRNHLHEM